MGILMYYKFNSLEHFNEWHEQIKSDLGLPLDDGITINYTEPIVTEENEIIAFSDEQYATNLPVIDYIPKASFA